MEAMIRRLLGRSSLIAILLPFVCLVSFGAFIFTRRLESAVAVIPGNPQKPVLTTKTMDHRAPETLQIHPKIIEIPLNCSPGTLPRICPANYYPSKVPSENNDSPPACPDYFRWIHDDLWPWRETGITKEVVMSASQTANFRLVILNGKAYVETYTKSFQSRDTFTLWGILQLLRKFPGKVPDLELMFDCVDWPVIRKETFHEPKYKSPPPLFRYCGDDATYDIVFPDWSFWGWPEINIKPWDNLSKDIKEGNMRTRWKDREPHAYWKGNPAVAATRMDLLKCNVSDKQDWNARVYAQGWLYCHHCCIHPAPDVKVFKGMFLSHSQPWTFDRTNVRTLKQLLEINLQDWKQEQEHGYKQSDLASQCIHRYKIYIEGSAWSVSEKYILACNSVTLLVKPHYYDFFTRNLMPLQHYWPIKEDDKCRSIKYAVDRGNSHKQEAQAIGKTASKFILEELKMDYVYDYMFHLLNEYAKLLTYKPTVPEKAVELCSESMACHAQGLEKKFMTDSLVKGPSYSNPCAMSQPYDPATLHSVLEKKQKNIQQVEAWEQQFWGTQDKQMLD